MNNQLICSNKIKELEFDKLGKELLSKNKFFNDLSELIDDQKFNNFYNNYMNNLDEIKSTFIYIKLYKVFQKKYTELTGKQLSKHVIMYLLYNIMCDSKIRPILLESTLKNLENPSIPIFKSTKKIKKKKVSFEELQDGVNYII